ncbi:DUF4139 domain-containing protein [Shimia marina]|uniref:DUF4139 domain-containing protein n=1 Tax=Shimia marina TaxID=321267 RepID=A0A0P1EQJ0_9RHOB|nr:DUF4139 domain-containing protein [Shimia marina]CUH52472.1 hypothetical protein SHM7688_01918 [Shimia marina]SFE12710.1 conserved hypothetical protein [Shimia marina]
MKHLIFTTALISLSSPIWADTIAVTAPVTAATLYSQGATLTRHATFNAPAGTHELLITNLPDSVDPSSMRVSLEGATLGAITLRNARTLPNVVEDSPELTAAKAARDAARDALRTTEDAKADALLAAEAAKARLAYLASLKAPTDAAPSPETLLATLTLISEQTLATQKDIASIERDARRFEQEIEDRTEDLQKAQQVVAALTPSLGDNVMLAIAISTSEATTGTLTLNHLIEDATWEPTYDVQLTTGDTPMLALKRGAFIGQSSGEDWRDVAITLSTSRPDAQTEPQALWPTLRRIAPKQEPLAYATDSRALKSAAAMAEPVLMEEFAGTIDFGDGINASYSYATPVTLTSDTEALRIELGTLNLTPTLYAHANPLYDDTAFMVAETTNISEEIILPSEYSNFYLNGTFIGQQGMPLIAQGDTAEFSFGTINGLRLSDVVNTRVTGDTGVITTRNEQSETRTLTVENLTGRDWDLRMIGRVPYSEQEDLVVSYTADIPPEEENYQDQRGILMWRHALKAEKSFSVRLSHTLQWPSDMELH